MSTRAVSTVESGVQPGLDPLGMFVRALETQVDISAQQQQRAADALIEASKLVTNSAGLLAETNKLMAGQAEAQCSTVDALAAQNVAITQLTTSLTEAIRIVAAQQDQKALITDLSHQVKNLSDAASRDDATAGERTGRLEKRVDKLEEAGSEGRVAKADLIYKAGMWLLAALALILLAYMATQLGLK